ncbi:MAG TPA: hypothetical protein VGF43_10595 [Dongiaceae bacterium]
MHDGAATKTDNRALDLDALIAIARGERSGEMLPATAARLAQFQAAFDAVPVPATTPAAICFAFHAPVPQADAAIQYRDVAIDHSKFDYDRIVRHCIASALAAQPGARFVLATDNAFLSDLSHPALTIVRLPLDAASPMYERVVAMCGFVRSRQFTAPTAFLDSDAFLNAPIAGLFQGHFDIGATYRPDPGLMPVDEGVIFAHSRNRDLVRGFFTGYLGTYDRLTQNATVSGYYGNVKRWRGGQLSLNALTCPPGVPSELDSAKAFGARIRYYPCATFNFPVEPDHSTHRFDGKAVLHLQGSRKEILDQVVDYQTTRWPQIATAFETPKPADPPAPAPQLAAESAQPGSAGTPASLAEIVRAAHPDAASRHHRRVPIYERYFDALRQAELNLLEIGTAADASEAVWSRYFRKAHVHKAAKAPDDCRLDIIIDDGSGAGPVDAFKDNWPSLKPSGLFVITGLEQTHDQQATRRSFMDLIDRCLGDMDRRRGDIEFIHFYEDIAFIKKAG